MQVRSLKLLLEHHDRLLELMRVHNLKVMALDERELTGSELNLAEKVKLFIQQPAGASGVGLVLPQITPFRAWMLPIAFCSAAAAAFLMRLQWAEEPVSGLVSKGASAVAAIGCDVRLKQLGRPDQDLQDHDFVIDPNLPSYMRLSCDPGVFAHVVLETKDGLVFKVQNQSLPSQADFIRFHQSHFDFTPLAMSGTKVILLLTRQAIRSEDQLGILEQVQHPRGTSLFWSEKIHFKLQ